MDLLKTKIKHKRHPNLTKAEILGIDQLKSNNDIIIKKADKVSAVVGTNITDHLREGKIIYIPSHQK